MTATTTKFTVKADIAKNRLYITFTGNLLPKALNSMYTDIRFGVADLKKGFTVITDLSQASLLHLAAIVTFRKIMHYLIASEVSTVVRVVGPETLLKHQLFNLTIRTKGYKPISVSSLHEAENLLEQISSQRQLRINLYDHPLIYLYDNQQYKGLIANISTSGCLIESDQKLPEIDKKMVLKISFQQKDGSKCDFELAATTVRVEQTGFAVNYPALDEETQKSLWQCLLFETQNNQKR